MPESTENNKIYYSFNQPEKGFLITNKRDQTLGRAVEIEHGLKESTVKIFLRDGYIVITPLMSKSCFVEAFIDEIGWLPLQDITEIIINSSSEIHIRFPRSEEKFAHLIIAPLKSKNIPYPWFGVTVTL